MTDWFFKAALRKIRSMRPVPKGLHLDENGKQIIIKIEKKNDR